MSKTHKLLYVLKENLHLNKHAAQAAGADPSKYNSTSRQNPPLQHNHHNSEPIMQFEFLRFKIS